MKPSTAVRPLRADAERNKRKIIDCARELVAHRGLDITLDDVAARAGLGVGTVYRRFANKKELFDGILEQQLADMLDQADRAAAAHDPWAAMLEFFESMFQSMASDRGLGDAVLGDNDGLARIAAIRCRLEPAIETIIVRAQHAGRMRPDVQPGDFFAIIRMVIAAAEVADEVDEDNWRRYFTIVIDGLAANPEHNTRLPGRSLTTEEIHRAKARLHRRGQ
ncbi:MAG: helix-turn-helix domain-containing protein [Rhodococcus sp. (in: high G+C Gram-positive bacteria)]